MKHISDLPIYAKVALKTEVPNIFRNDELMDRAIVIDIPPVGRPTKHGSYFVLCPKSLSPSYVVSPSGVYQLPDRFREWGDESIVVTLDIDLDYRHISQLNPPVGLNDIPSGNSDD